VGVFIGYDEARAHRMIAGADLIGVPSRFEPCGLTQLYGLRYGTLPIVHRVGGLADTVVDADESAVREGRATGFAFQGAHRDALVEAMRRARACWDDPQQWQQLMRQAMSEDTSWRQPASQYAELYAALLGDTPRG
jgi:starch synthase